MIFVYILLFFIACVLIIKIIEFIAFKISPPPNTPITPTNIINNTYYKCMEKNHNPPTTRVLNNNNIVRVEDPKECNLYIPCGYNMVEIELWSLDLNDNVIIYGIVGCDKIVSKNNIWDMLESHYGRQESTNYMPLTYIVSNKSHIDELNNSHKEGYKYILKKNLQRKRGLLIIDSLTKINNILDEDFKIIQKYIVNPLLINKRKLNIRIYVAVLYKNRKTRIYMYNEGKCIYTNKDYINNDISDPERNITSLNLNNDIYTINPLLFSDLIKYMNNNNNNNNNNNKGDKLYNDIIILMKNVWLPIKPEICNNYPNIIDNTCYQLFGGDIIVTEDYKPLLLEFNKGPSMKTDIERDIGMKHTLISDLFKLSGVISTKDNTHMKNFIEL